MTDSAGNASDQRAGAQGDVDDTLIRPTRDFYAGEQGGAEAAPAPQGGGRPTLAERIMHRMPAPPEKAEARKEYDERQAAQEAERQKALERLQAEDEAQSETDPILPPSAGTASAGTPAPAATPAPAPAATPAPAPHPAVVAPAPAAAAPVAAAQGASVQGASVQGPSAQATPNRPTSATERIEDPPPKPAVRPRRTRKARLRVSRVDPWSVMKTFFLFSIAGGIMFFTAVALIYTVIEGSGLFDQIDELVGLVFDTPTEDTGFQIRQVLGWERVMGVTALLACVNVMILTALATLGSFLYNLAATMLGGFEVTLAED